MRALGNRPDQLKGRTLYKPEGCSKCERTGYLGRKGVFELLELDSGLRELIFQGVPAGTIREQARSSGRMTTLLEDGARKVISGLTTVQEILRIAHALE